MLMPAPRTRWSMIAKVLAWWRPRMQANSERSGRETVSPGGGSWEPDTSPLGVPAYDVSLLFRRLAVLQVDRDALASDDPLLFREFRGYARCVGAKHDACGILRAKAMRPGGKIGANTAPTPRRSTRSARCKTAVGPHDT